MLASLSFGMRSKFEADPLDAADGDAGHRHGGARLQAPDVLELRHDFITFAVGRKFAVGDLRHHEE